MSDEMDSDGYGWETPPDMASVAALVARFKPVAEGWPHSGTDWVVANLLWLHEQYAALPRCEQCGRR